jgi:L-amino acid N-acyltransferase YncA
MTNTIPIESARIDDAASIAEIYDHYVANGTASFEMEPPGAAEMAQRIEKVMAGGYPWLVARGAQGEVLGYAYASQFGSRAGYRFSCETSIYVRHDALGQGIGTRLLGALVEQCEAIGLRQAFAIIAGTEPASVVLHARHGFRPCGTLENAGRKHGQWIDVFYMQRPLGEGAGTPPADEL